ncbi:hypothetical protein L1887_02827 [Cichorium endivia]|nr:hypothetical protein L1887_02827 [Cichorium endivia]
MRILYVCEEEEKELSRQEAPGACPKCGGKVEAVDCANKWRFCFVPVCNVTKRRYICTLCSKRLMLGKRLIKNMQGEANPNTGPTMM